MNALPRRGFCVYGVGSLISPFGGAAGTRATDATIKRTDAKCYRASIARLRAWANRHRLASFSLKEFANGRFDDERAGRPHPVLDAVLIEEFEDFGVETQAGDSA